MSQRVLQKTYYLVMNSASGSQEAAETRQTIERVLSARGCSFSLAVFTGARELFAAARDSARKAQAEGGVVVAVGGDGTINAVAQEAWKQGSVLGILPRGTFNFFGREHGISEDLEEALEQLLTGEAAPVQMGLVNE